MAEATQRTEITRNAQKILARVKGLREHMQPDEFPLLNVPAIWDSDVSEQQGRSIPGDVIVTNQRIIGYALTTFPRKRLFFDALPLSQLTTVSLRNKSHEPLFRELLISDGKRKVYVRAPQKQMSLLHTMLRHAIESYASTSATQVEEKTLTEPENATPTGPVYGTQDIRAPFERSLLAIVLLFVGGLVLEIIGASAWSATGSSQIGLPLVIAGLLAFIFSIIVLRQRQRR